MRLRWLLAATSIVLVGCGGAGKGNGQLDLAGVDGTGGNTVGVNITIVGSGTVANGGTTVCDGSTASCSFTAQANTQLTLTGVPAEGYAFTSWQCGSGAPTTVAALTTSTGASGVSCTVTFTKQQYTLTINVSPSASGTVLGTPGSLQCGVGGTACSTLQDYGTTVNLTLVKAQFYNFTGWSGDCSGTAESVNVTITKNMTCTAQLTAVTFPLTMSVLGPNGDAGPWGTLQTAPDVGSCSASTCAAVNVAGGTALTITAVPAANYQVSDWGGDCIGTGSAATINSIVMNAAKSCSVRMVKQKRKLELLVTGGGHVTSDTGGIDAPGAQTSAEYDHGTVVQLTAAPTAVGATFNGWGGDCAGSGTTTPINVTMDKAKSCTAGFSTNVPVALTFGINTASTGTVDMWIDKPANGSPDQSCTTVNPTGCTNSTTINAGQKVNLKATAQAGYVFDHWSGTNGSECTGSTNPFQLSMNSDKTCTAYFVKEWTITYSGTTSPSGTGGTVTGNANCATSGCKVKDGTAIVLTAQTNDPTGYRIETWGCTQTGGSSTVTLNPSTFSSATPATTATATFNANSNVTCTAGFRQRVSVIGSVVGTGTVAPTAAKTIDVANGEKYSLTFSASQSGSPRRIKALTGTFASGSGTSSPADVCNKTFTDAPTSAVVDVAIATSPLNGSYKCEATVVNRITLSVNTKVDGVVQASPAAAISPTAGLGAVPADCSGGGCSIDAGGGTQATLTAKTGTAAPGLIFTGWTGNTPDCQTTGMSATPNPVATIIGETANVSCTANYITATTVPSLVSTAQVATPTWSKVHDGKTCGDNQVTFSGAAGTGTFMCKLAPTSASAGAESFDKATYVKCANAAGANTGQLITPAKVYTQGNYRLSVVWDSGNYRSPELYSSDFYMHSTLDCAVPCKFNLGEQSYFDFAAQTTSFKYAKYNWESGQSYASRALAGQGKFDPVPTLRNPSVEITFNGLHHQARLGGYFVETNFPLKTQVIKRKSLRRTFTLSGKGDLLLIRRNFESSRVKAAIGTHKCSMSIETGVTIPVRYSQTQKLWRSQHAYNSHRSLACDGILLNSRGEGICVKEVEASPGKWVIQRVDHAQLPVTGASLDMWMRLLDTVHKEDWRADELTLPE